MSWERLTADCLSLPRAGETASRPKAISAGTIHMGLEDTGGATLALGGSGAANLTEVIGDFRAASGGMYYARITGTSVTPYSLVVTRNAAFDLNNNHSLGTAQDIGPLGRVLGSAAAAVNGV